MKLSQLKRQNKIETVAWLVATWFASGCSPKAPGTVGSFFALPVVLLGMFLGTISFFFVIVSLFLLGLWATNIVLKTQENQDPGFVVIDEVVGQSLTFVLLASDPISWYKILYIMLCGFALFRLFDIGKPWPASYFDGKVHNAFGVMMDDVVAGLYAGIILYAISFLI